VVGRERRGPGWKLEGVLLRELTPGGIGYTAAIRLGTAFARNPSDRFNVGSALIRLLLFGPLEA
jgi:hypothetical protein